MGELSGRHLGEAEVRAERVCVAAVLATALLATNASIMHAAEAQSLQGTVTTVAGSGDAGTRDGSASAASFDFPVGLAYDGDARRVLVVDSAGQRIRAISEDGSVSTVAGSGAQMAGGLTVAGGYADGPAASARFNQPSGVTRSPSGTIYVADTLNHCIRAIDKGAVSTFAGSATKSGAQDGPISGATFTQPRQVAAARSGDLYVFDFSVGVRLIRDGRVTTLDIPGASTAVGMALLDSTDPVIFLATVTGLERYDTGTKKLDAFAATTQHPTGLAPSGIVPLTHDSAVVSSSKWSGLFYIHFQDANQPAFSRMIAGEDLDDPVQVGGFRDGSGSAARFFAPSGLILDARRNVLIADSGNRRVRMLAGLDERWDDGTFASAGDPGNRVLLVGGTAVFWNSLFSDSIAGRLESRLNSDAPSSVPHTPVHVAVLTTGTRPIELAAREIEALLPTARPRLIVWSLDSGSLHESTDTIRNAFMAMARAAKSHDARLIAVMHPLGDEAGEIPLGIIVGRSAPVAEPPSGDAVASIARAAEVPIYPTIGDFTKQVAGPHDSLFDVMDPYFTRAGNDFYASVLARIIVDSKVLQ